MKRSGKDPVFRKVPNVISRKEAGGYSLVKMDNFDFFFKVDQWAAECWSLIDGRRSQEKICEKIAAMSHLNNKTVVTEVKKLTTALHKFQLIERVS